MGVAALMAICGYFGEDDETYYDEERDLIICKTCGEPAGIACRNHAEG